MAYIPVERTGGMEGINAVQRFMAVQQEMQQNAVQTQLMESRLQTEGLERQAMTFELGEAKSMAPMHRAMKILEHESAKRKDFVEGLTVTERPQRMAEAESMFNIEKERKIGENTEGDIRRQGMQQAMTQQQRQYEDSVMTGTVMGDLYSQQIEKMGGGKIPGPARKYLAGQLGMNFTQQLLQAHQFNQELDVRKAEATAKLNKSTNFWEDPKETMVTLKGFADLARNNPEGFKAYRDRVQDPDLASVLDGIMEGSSSGKDLMESATQRIQEAKESDDPGLRDSALNAEALFLAGNIRPQQLYDANQQPVMMEDPMTGEQKPVEVPATMMLKKDLAKLFGPKPKATASKTASNTSGGKASTRPSQFLGARTGVLMADLAEAGAPGKVQAQVSDAMAQYRLTGNKADLAGAKALFESLPEDQQQIVRAEIDRIQARK
jgi:hypothetical protein